MSYRIGEVAGLSGFAAATLRYYEQIGLLPEPSRTASGYRDYDDGTLARLAFIARAKRLGCSLEEIGDLLVAWDGGRCGPVKDRLEMLVAAKRRETAAQIDELTTFATELEHAVVALGGHRPDGPCDDRCGCATDAAPVTLAPRPVTNDEPIACTLAPDAMPQRIREWEAVVAGATRRHRIEGGVRLDFASDVDAGALARLAAAEHSCCSFLSFAVVIDRTGVALEIRAPEDAREVLEALAGAAT